MSIRIPTRLWVVLFIGLLALLLVGPLWQLPGLPGGTSDALIHVHRSSAVQRGFEQGVYWPRWFPAVYDGLGAPTFHHYSPGLYWLVAAVHSVGVRLDQALKVVVTAALLLSGFGVYAWLRHTFSPGASLAAVAVYLCNLYNVARAFYSPGLFGGAFPQLLALLLLPICLWAFTALHKDSRLRNWLAAVVSLAALVLSHNLTAMLGVAILCLYGLLLAVGYRRLDGLIRNGLAALLAALLSAVFWLPALADLSFVQIESAREEYFHYSNHFLNWWQLFVFQSPVLDSRDGNPLMPLFTFGAALWLAIAAGLCSALFAAGSERRIWGLAGGLLALAMTTLTLSVSEPLWRTMPGLSFLQTPSRFLGVAPLSALPAAALAVDAWAAGRRWLPGLFLIMASILVVFPYLFPSHTSFSPALPVKALTAEDTRLFEQTTKDWGLTTSNEFLVRGADIGVVSGQIPEPSAARPTWRSPHEASVDLSGQAEPILLRLHYHPGWGAGGQAVVAPGPAGWIQVTEVRNPDLPLVLRWEGTVAQRWGERLSMVGLLASAVGLLYLALRSRGHHRRREAPASSHRSTTLTLGAITGCVFVIAVLHFALSRSNGGPFLFDSPPGRLAFSVEGQPTTVGNADGSQVTLLGWKLISSDSPEPGGTVRVRLYWQPHGQIREELLSFLHLYTPSLKRSWAVDNHGVARPDSQWWDPGKYYVDDIRLSLPPDLPPLSYSLVAGLVTSDGERLTVPGSADNLLHLRTLDVAPLRPGLFQRERPTIDAQAATDDGLRLQGYDLLPTHGGPTLRLFWETGDGIANDWITYIHLYDDQGERVAQFDGPALAGLLPTNQWHTNALYIDRRQLNLPAELASGAYLLRIGLYDPASGQRLPFQPDGGEQHHFEDGQLLIKLAVPLPEEASE